MTNEEMAMLTKLLLDNPHFDKFVPYYLENAKAVIINTMYPYDTSKTWEDIPTVHHTKAVDIAVYLINKRGAEGETQHSESGVSRTYESADIPKSLLRGIAPYVGVI